MLVVKKSPVVLIPAGALFISFSGVWVTWAAVHPLVSAFYRVFFATLFLVVICVLKRDYQALTCRQWLLVLLAGISFSGDLVCWHAAIGAIGPGLATILGNFQVFLLTGLAIFLLHEKYTLKFFISIPLAFLGIAMIIGLDLGQLSSNDRTGIFLGLATAAFYAIFILILRKLQASLATGSIFFSLMLCSASTALVLAGALLFSNHSFAIAVGSPLGSLISLGLFSQVIGWLLITNGLPLTSPAIAGLMLLLQPALAFCWDVLIFNRQTALLNWLGVCLALAAIYMGMSNRPKVN